MKRLPSLVTLFVVLGLCAQDRNGYVKVAGIEIGGTRLPTQSIVRLLGLTIGHMVNSDLSIRRVIVSRARVWLLASTLLPPPAG